MKVRRTLAKSTLVLASLVLGACQSFLTTPDKNSENRLSAVSANAMQSCPPPSKALLADDWDSLVVRAKDRGVLFRLSKGGEFGFLYGTIHTSRRDWMIPGHTLQSVLTVTDVVALELNIFDPDTSKKFSAKVAAQQPSYQPSNDIQARVEKLAARLCVTPDQLRSGGVMNALVSADLRYEGFETLYGSESFLFGFASREKLPIESLETIEAHAADHWSASLSESDYWESVSKLLRRIENGSNRKSIGKLAEVWANGRLDQVRDLFCDGCSPAQLKQIDDRNPAMAVSLDKLLNEGNVVFAAIGVLHLTGPKAMPILLREMGYKVQRIEF